MPPADASSPEPSYVHHDGKVAGGGVASITIDFEGFLMTASKMAGPAGAQGAPAFGVAVVRIREDLLPAWSNQPDWKPWRLGFTPGMILESDPTIKDVHFTNFGDPYDTRVTYYKVGRSPWEMAFTEEDFTGRYGNRITKLGLFVVTRSTEEFAFPPMVELARGEQKRETVKIERKALAGSRAGGRVRTLNAPVFGAARPWNPGATVFGQRPGVLRGLL